jgi:hypothetical protein
MCQALAGNFLAGLHWKRPRAASCSSKMISFSNINKQYGKQLLFVDAFVSVESRRKSWAGRSQRGGQDNAIPYGGRRGDSRRGRGLCAQEVDEQTGRSPFFAARTRHKWRTIKSTSRACQVYFSRHPTSSKVDISSTAELVESIDSSKSQDVESTTYAENFLQSEMFQLEHSAQCSGAYFPT